ncbi:MAG: hypothetical protein NVSMB7_03880 [Chitinophagaceae bacterium]
MLQSYKYSSPVIPRAVISFFGPALYQQSSPINFVTAQSSPTLLLQGGADPLVPPVQASALRDKLQRLGVANQYVFYPAEGHGWVGEDLNDSFTKIFAFLKQHVN